MAASDKPKILGTFWKQSCEEIPSGRWIVSFAPDLITGETLVSATMTTTSVEDADLSSITLGAPSCGTTGVSFSCEGGLNDATYHVHIDVVTSEGAGLAADVYIRIHNV